MLLGCDRSIDGQRAMNRAKHAIEAVVVGSRWLIVPFLLGLILGLALLVFKFLGKLANVVIELPSTPPSEVIVGILNLVDLTLIANLTVIVICSSYENFVAPIKLAQHSGRPQGLVGIGFSGLKQKLLGSIVAIASVNVLEWFIDIEHNTDNTKLAWVVGLLMAFALATLVLAIADRVSAAEDHNGG